VETRGGRFRLSSRARWDHPDETADVRVPDVALAIGGKRIRTALLARQRPELHLTFAQPAQPPAAQNAEPDRAILGHRDSRGCSLAFGQRVLDELAVHEVRYLIAAEFDQPDSALRVHGHVSG